MTARTSPWPEGSLCWADNHVPDLDLARAFYGAVLGWQIDDPDLGAGNLSAARIDGRPVAGFLVGVDGASPGWHAFLAAEDIDATAAAILRHGGTGLFGPHAVPVDRGRFHLATDAGGALFGVWQAGSLLGTGVYGAHGALGQAVLHTGDAAAAEAFYGAIFVDDGLLVRPPVEAGAPVIRVGGAPGPGEDTHWQVCFVVDDVEAALAAGTSAGGTVVGSPDGQAAGLVDPFGAAFDVVASTG